MTELKEFDLADDNVQPWWSAITFESLLGKLPPEIRAKFEEKTKNLVPDLGRGQKLNIDGPVNPYDVALLLSNIHYCMTVNEAGGVMRFATDDGRFYTYSSDPRISRLSAQVVAEIMDLNYWPLYDSEDPNSLVVHNFSAST